MFSFDLERLLVWLPAVVLAVTFHEYAHGTVADLLGDPTPRFQGRLTLNPLAHLDPLGFLLLLFAGFGWARPVPVNPAHFRDPRRGMVLVAAAGPAANLLVAFTAALILVAALPNDAVLGSSHYLVAVLRALVTLNVYLAVFNLLPVPPLDGGRVLAGLVSSGEFIYILERYGPLILLVLIATGAIGRLLLPVATSTIGIISLLAHVLVALFT